MTKLFDAGSRSELLATPIGARATGEWFEIGQDVIDRFADATDDHQWIHVDAARAAREMPGGRTIAHGFLVLSLLPQQLGRLWSLRNLRTGLNYGGERLRFISPVPSGSRLRLTAEVAAVEEAKAGGVRIAFDCTFELKGSERPAVRITFIGLFFVDEDQTAQ